LNQLDAPSFRAISEFRKRLAAARDGLVKFGHVAVDGTEINKNVSMHKTMNDGLAAQEPKCRKSDFWSNRKTAPGRHAHRRRDRSSSLTPLVR
jgi:hypothetical protein